MISISIGKDLDSFKLQRRKYFYAFEKTTYVIVLTIINNTYHSN